MVGDDGSNDAQGEGNRLADSWYYDLAVDESSWGQWAHFDVSGTAVTLLPFFGDIEFFESRVPYTVDVMLTMDLSQPVNIEFEQRPDFYSDLNPTTPSEEYEDSMDGMLTFTRKAYDQATVVSLITPKTTEAESDSQGFFSSLGGVIADHPFAVIISLLMLIGVAGSAGYAVRLQTEDEIEEAVLMGESKANPSPRLKTKRDQGSQSFWLRCGLNSSGLSCCSSRSSNQITQWKVPMPSSSVTLLLSCMM